MRTLRIALVGSTVIPSGNAWKPHSESQTMHVNGLTDPVLGRLPGRAYVKMACIGCADGGMEIGRKKGRAVEA